MQQSSKAALMLRRSQDVYARQVRLPNLHEGSRVAKTANKSGPLTLEASAAFAGTVLRHSKVRRAKTSNPVTLYPSPLRLASRPKRPTGCCNLSPLVGVSGQSSLLNSARWRPTERKVVGGQVARRFARITAGPCPACRAWMPKTRGCCTPQVGLSPRARSLS